MPRYRVPVRVVVTLDAEDLEAANQIAYEYAQTLYLIDEENTELVAVDYMSIREEG